jgi:hypothetical protein
MARNNHSTTAQNLPTAARRRRTGGISNVVPPAAPGSLPTEPAPALPLPLPHERDQAVHQTASQPDKVIAQAKRDLDAGMVDTDMRATPGTDAQRREAMVPTPPAREPGKR